ncbi:MAG: 4Fe-4S dicluster domain-containing protein [Candidatus Desantisbacteria bacterium]
MARLDLVSKIFAPERLTTFQSQCLRERYPQHDCNICLKNCPYEAIEFGKRIAVDETKCQGCGICTHMCPAGVFELNNWPDIVKQNRAAVNDRQVRIGCNKVKDRVDGEVPCLGLVSEGFLLSLAEKGAENICLDASACEDCPANQGRSLAVIKVSTTIEILRRFGHNPKIFFQTEHQESIPGKGGYSRRGFFLHLRDSAVKGIASFKEPAPAVGKQIEHRVSNARLLLLGSLQRLGQPMPEVLPPPGRIIHGDSISGEGIAPGRDSTSGNGLPFYQVEISQACNACEFCSRLCPTGALSKLITDESEKIEKIRFNLKLCTGCGLCQKICPNEAIGFAKEVDLSWLLKAEEQELVSYAYLKCPDCERLYLEIEGGCSFCKKEVAVDTFFDEICQ